MPGSENVSDTHIVIIIIDTPHQLGVQGYERNKNG